MKSHCVYRCHNQTMTEERPLMWSINEYVRPVPPNVRAAAPTDSFKALTSVSLSFPLIPVYITSPFSLLSHSEEPTPQNPQHKYRPTYHPGQSQRLHPAALLRHHLHSPHCVVQRGSHGIENVRLQHVEHVSVFNFHADRVKERLWMKAYVVVD